MKKKNTAENFLNLFLIKNFNLLIPSPSKLQENLLTLKREHPALQKIKFFWVIFALLDPDCESVSGSTTLPLGHLG
jgi:hypothetical protein